jgi:cytoskeleton protein RodZ
MSGIGDTLRTERQRQGRTLADAATETRVRESYLAAIEAEDFGVLGGDVYARGFIRLYARYLGLDAEALVEVFRRDHERPEEVTAIPGATIDEVMPGRPPLWLSQPVLAATGLVLVLVVLFLVLRGGGDEPADDLGPSPAATAPTVAAAGTTPAATGAPAPPAPAADGPLLTRVEVVVTAVQPLELTVTRGQPPVDGAPLAAGDVRTITDPAGESVVFTVSDFGAADITVNGGPLEEPSLAGRAVQITCTVGETGCQAVPL